MICIENVTKTYEINSVKFDALLNVNLDVKKGEALLLRGHSGSGKSTLLSIIGGLLKPSFGKVFVNEISLAKIPDDYAALFRREHVGFIFQRYNLIPDITVFENVIAPLLPTDLSYKVCREKTIKAMKTANIFHKVGQKVFSLSGGEQQRVAIARALVHEPMVLLADEPSANLDSLLTLNFLEEMKAIKKMGKTLVVASHDETLLKSPLFDKIITLNKGEICDTN
ncbi:MAG: ABC transporter ATP-binding protein [Campylobacteraceae bacterium]|nr:ABC transporter ATP-binding protein [Campylobacteraceae bacterium]